MLNSFANSMNFIYETALVILMQNNDSTLDWQNNSNFSYYGEEEYYAEEEYFDSQADIFSDLPGLKAFFYAIYITIFSVGICGNVLVCYVVFQKKSMHTVTNLYIANLALSDLLLCTFSVPLTPLYIFRSQWLLGRTLCYLVPYTQGVSVYVSAFSLTAIAADRFVVVIYTYKPKLRYCYLQIVLIWLISCLLTLPYGIFMDLVPSGEGFDCEEVWPESSRRIFSLLTSILQFVFPFIIISFCYIKICIKLKERARNKPGARSIEKEELDRKRTRRLIGMLMAMVGIFVASWLPLNFYNLITDFYIPASSWKFIYVIYVLCHASAMCSVCYNPFLYAWLNENFRQQFKTVLPCFKSTEKVSNVTARQILRIKMSCNDLNRHNVTILPMEKIPKKETESPPLDTTLL